MPILSRKIYADVGIPCFRWRPRQRFQSLYNWLEVGGDANKSSDADVISGIQRHDNKLGAEGNKSYFVLKNIDLNGIKQLTYYYASKADAAILEVHVDSTKGAVISTLNYRLTGDWNKFKQATATITNTEGKHDLYFVFKKEDAVVGEGICLLDWVRFGR